MHLMKVWKVKLCKKVSHKKKNNKNIDGILPVLHVIPVIT